MTRTLAPMALLVGLLSAPADAREPERMHLSGSHWDGSGTLQLVHPTAIGRRNGYAGAWAGSASDVGWTNEPFTRTAGAGFHAGYALINNLRLEASLPVWASLGRTDGAGNTFASNGLGDLRLGATVPLLFGDSGVGLALAPAVAVPTGDAAAATGGTVGSSVLVALGGRTDPTSARTGRGVGWRLNAGWHGGGAPEANGIRLGAGVDGSAAPGVVVGAELTTLLRGQQAQDTGTPDPVDAHGYVTLGLDEHLSGTLAGGAGLTGGEGDPRWRALMSVAWHAAGENPDPDGDGVKGAADLCPNTPEPATGDGDGCPDPDKDGDGIPDGVDDCPMEPEDLDGYSDADGCPDLDNDQDGLMDDNDACPYDPGPLVTEGCPDFDGDGLADRADECPERRGPKRSFGCPDMDGDDVPDYRDACPGEADHADADPLRSDGCPGLAYPTGDRIELTDQVRFDTGRASIRPESLPVLDAVAAILKRNPDIKLLEVAGHTDAVGSKASNLRLSRLRAASVRSYLIRQGVAPERLTAKGYGESMPMDTNATDDGRFFNRRVEFLIERSATASADR